MRIVHNYILRELFGPLLLALTIFTFVLIMGNFIKLADLVINKGVGIFSVGKLFLLLIPYLLSFSIPMSVSTAALLAFGRLSSDNEITAMRASGISIMRIISPVIAISALLSLLLVPLNDKVLPRAHFAFRVLLKDIGLKQPTAYIQSGTFIKEFEGYIIFIYSIKKNKMKNIRIYQPREGKPTRVIIAERGTFLPHVDKSILKLKLENGTSTEPDPSDPAKLFTLHFKSYNMVLDLTNSNNSGTLGKKDKELTIRELKEEIAKLKEKNIDTVPLYVEIYNKISTAFSPLAFVIVALPLAIGTGRSEKSIGFGLSLIIIIFYWALTALAEVVALYHLLPPLLAMWIPNLLLFSVGCIMLVRLSRK